MINEIVSSGRVRLHVFDHDNDEFEKVRQKCLQEDNWLRENYTKERCVVEDHKLFWIAYLDDKLWHFSGLLELSPHVARILNRTYMFPEWRSPRQITYHHDQLANHVIPLVEQVLGFEYDLLFFSMQRRKRGYQVKKQPWYENVKRSWMSVTDKWKSFDDGLVRIYPDEQESCYQNVMYKSNGYTLQDWGPRIITYEEYIEKFYKKDEDFFVSWQ